jgi:NTP pyrophosphatase (non-canonical NTP hydrolase)
MTGNEYQQLAARTAPKDCMRERLLNYCLGLVGEAGELIDHVKKVLYHGHPTNKPKVREEAGDMLWYIANILREFDITLDEVMALNIEKLRQRYPEGFSEERSRNRRELDYDDDGL